MKRWMLILLFSGQAVMLAACSLIPLVSQAGKVEQTAAALPAPTQTAEPPTQALPTGAPTPAALPTETAVPSLVLSVKVTQEAVQEPKKYQIDARWPYLEWGGDPRVDAFNQAADQLVLNEIQNFKKGVEDTPPDEVIGEVFSSLKIDFVPTNDQNGVFSVLYKVTFYLAGGAHPGQYSHSFNYDLLNGRVLGLSDLFQPDSPYLESISSACIEDLKARDALAWEDGALPKPENYQVWNVTPEGLLITFDTYQVAPYASGPQAVMVPYDRLRDLIRPDGPLAAYLAQ